MLTHCRSAYWPSVILAMLSAASALAQSDAKKADDPGWPRVFEKDGRKVAVFQPQIDSWNNYSKIQFRSAVAVSTDPNGEPVYGAIATEADTKVDPDTRMVAITNLEPDIRFASVSGDREKAIEAIVQDALSKKQVIEVSLDRMLAYMNTKQTAQPDVKVGVAPPQIFYSDKPAVLLLFQGEPQFKPVASAGGVMFAVNANWDVLLDNASSKYYLLDGESWLVAPDTLTGPWTAAGKLPDSFSKLPDNDQWKDVRAKMPGKPAESVPAVFASAKPAEIIVTDGEPKYTPIPGTKLMYVGNTQNPLFLCNADGRHYYLVAGRWFRAQGIAGPWESATASLPLEFQKIPADSPMAYVLASVPKTDAAEDAVLLASVPHKATVNRNEAKLDVTYDGAPAFGTIKGTQVKCAVNTEDEVFEVNGVYYCCKDGVWFVANDPNGPWAVCDKVPDEIYAIPADFPAHNVTYVHVYDSTPDTVEVGYTGGYLGQYVYDGVLVYGAGVAAGYALAHEWYEDWNPYWDRYYPYWYWRPYWSYGRGAVYYPFWGGYYAGYGAIVGPYGGAVWAYGPYRGAARFAHYNPSTGIYSRGVYGYGPAWGAHAWAAYNPHTDTAAYHAGGHGIYGSWGRTAVVRDDEWIRGGHATTPAGRTGWVQTSEGGEAIRTTRGVDKFIGKTGEGDIYAGRDGNVYRRDDGQWQKWDDGQWNDVNPPPKGEAARDNRPAERQPGQAWQARDGGARQPNQVPQPRTSNLRTGTDLGSGAGLHSDLNYNHQARQYGNYRSNEYQRARSSPQPAQSYRPPTRSNYSRPSSSPSRGGGGGRGRG